jgi:hypothetical protein
MPRSYPALPAISAALRETRIRFSKNAFLKLNAYTAITAEDREIAERFDVSKELEEAQRYAFIYLLVQPEYNPMHGHSLP